MMTWTNVKEIKAAYESGKPFWKPDYYRIEEILNSDTNPCPVFNVSARNVLQDYEKVDTHLSQFLMQCNPDWWRGAQGIGDCVSWGAELACTVLNAKQLVKSGNVSEFVEAATEPTYGGSRVEARGKSGGGTRPVGGWSDGSFGVSAAEWLKEWGVTWRKDYSGITGNPNHDYRIYDPKKAKNEGAYGAGGKDDGGRIDKIAREFPLKTVSQVNSFDDVAACIAGSKCPVTNASMYGCSMRRNERGECNWTKSWAHQMVWLDVRFGRYPAVKCYQSWGPRVASGPSGDEFTENLPEGGTQPNLLGCSWWMPAEDVDKVCRTGDCWAYGDITGEWRIDKFDWKKNMWR